MMTGNVAQVFRHGRGVGRHAARHAGGAADRRPPRVRGPGPGREAWRSWNADESRRTVDVPGVGRRRELGRADAGGPPPRVVPLDVPVRANGRHRSCRTPRCASASERRSSAPLDRRAASGSSTCGTPPTAPGSSTCSWPSGLAEPVSPPGARRSGSGWRKSAAAFSLQSLRRSAGGQVAPRLLDHGLGVGPGAVAVGVVDLHHDVVDPDGVAGVDRRRVVDGAEPEAAAQHVGRALVPAHAVAGAVDEVVEPVEQHGHPADAALGHRHLAGRGSARSSPAHSHSVHACSESWLNSVATSGMIARSQPGGISPIPDEPTCRHTTVPVSAQASRIGAQCSSKIDG